MSSETSKDTAKDTAEDKSKDTSKDGEDEHFEPEKISRQKLTIEAQLDDLNFK